MIQKYHGRYGIGNLFVDRNYKTMKGILSHINSFFSVYRVKNVVYLEFKQVKENFRIVGIKYLLL
jgi:hypothetical protein